MPYKKRTNKKRQKRRAGQRRMNYSRLIKTIKRVDTRQEFKRAPTLRSEKSYGGAVATPQCLLSEALIQAPFQDISLSLGTLDKNQRLGSVIYPQFLKFNGILSRKTGDTDIQRFRVMVIRYNGESDMLIDNSLNNGFEKTSIQWAHVCVPGQMWSSLPYLKNQMKVLYDKTYVVNDSNKTGVVVNLSVPIRRKLTFETTGSGSNAIGAGNIYLMISSDKSYSLSNYKTYAFYKDLQ